MGSAGSGNFNHAGRPGEVGGSGGGAARVPMNGFSVHGERMPDRKIGGSSMERKVLAQHTAFDQPVKVVVSGSGGYRSRTAEDVVAIDLPKEQGGDIIFHRRYPGGRIIPSPYRSKNITNIKIRTAHSQPDRNYFLS